MSIPDSLTIPSPILSPSATMNSFCKSENLLFSDSMCKWYHIILILSVWFTSHPMTVSRSIHGACKWHYFILLFFFFLKCLCDTPLLEKEMATPSRILAWRSPWTEEPGGLQCTGSQELDTAEWLNQYPLAYLYHIFIHSSLDGHLGCLHVLAVIDSAAVNMGLLGSLWMMVLSNICPVVWWFYF